MSNQLLVYEWMIPGGEKNFGDLLSKPIIEKILNEKVVQVSDENANFLGIGSVLDPINETFKDVKWIWGSGYLREGESMNRDDVTVIAARGKLTQARLGSDVPLGDPGLLVSKFFPKSEKSDDVVGVVSHFLDRDDLAFEKWKADSNFRFIDVNQNPEQVIKEITSCKIIVSTSLHGLIVADSFGIPNFWAKLSPNVGTYKFMDYYSGVGKKVEDSVVDDIFEKDFEELQIFAKNWIPVNGLKRIQDDLIKSLRNSIGKIKIDGEEEGLYHVAINDFNLPNRDLNWVRLHTNRRKSRNVAEFSKYRRVLKKKGLSELRNTEHYSDWVRPTNLRTKYKFTALSFCRDIKHSLSNVVKRAEV